MDSQFQSAAPVPLHRDKLLLNMDTGVGEFDRVFERVKGIEPSTPAWKAGALPLSYTR